MIIRRIIVTNFAENTYIVADDETKTALIIDPGDEEDAILGAVKDLGLEVKLVANTHSHSDHIMAVAPIVKATGCDYAISAAEYAFLTSNPPKSNAYITVRELPPPPTHAVADGDEIVAGPMKFKVLATPGHTPGGVCYYNAENNVVFTGDTLFQSSIGRTDFSGGSLAQIITSIREKLLTLPDETVVLSGHGDPTTIGRERQFNPFLQ